MDPQVELHRAALERRERALEERQRMLEQISTELSERERRLLETRPSDGEESRDAALSAREASLAASRYRRRNWRRSCGRPATRARLRRRSASRG